MSSLPVGQPLKKGNGEVVVERKANETTPVAEGYFAMITNSTTPSTLVVTDGTAVAGVAGVIYKGNQQLVLNAAEIAVVSDDSAWSMNDTVFISNDGKATKTPTNWSCGYITRGKENGVDSQGNTVNNVVLIAFTGIKYGGYTVTRSAEPQKIQKIKEGGK